MSEYILAPEILEKGSVGITKKTLNLEKEMAEGETVVSIAEQKIYVVNEDGSLTETAGELQITALGFSGKEVELTLISGVPGKLYAIKSRVATTEQEIPIEHRIIVK